MDMKQYSPNAFGRVLDPFSTLQIYFIILVKPKELKNLK
jgi:hypothetical protein